MAPTTEKLAGQCPYCGIQFAHQGSTADHIFQAFLGGRRTIRACKPCNDKYGRGFEGTVARELSGFIVLLSRSGYKHSRVVALTRAWTDPETTFVYDATSDGGLRLSDPIIDRDSRGEVTSIHVRSKEEADKLTRRIRGKGVRLEFHSEEKQIPAPQLTAGIRISNDLRRTAAKICIALSQLADLPSLPTVTWARELLDGPAVEDRVRRVLSPLNPIPDLPALSHAVQVEGDPDSESCVGIVQLFGAACAIHVLLDAQYSGPPFAIRGILNVVTGAESFSHASHIGVSRPAAIEPLPDVLKFYKTWPDELNRQILAAFGSKAVTLTATDTQLIPRVGLMVPLIWTEYSLALHFASTLRAISPNREDVHFPTHFANWQFRRSDGTPIALGAELQTAWDSGALSRIEGSTHEYVPALPSGTQMLLLPDYWMLVEKLSIHYRVERKCWLSEVEATCLGNVLDLATDSLSGDIRISATHIPKSRDPSWARIENPDRFQKKETLHLAAECAAIDLKTAATTGVRMSHRPAKR